MAFSKNQQLLVEITGMTGEGNGVARVDGMVIFVPYTCVGDVAEIQLVKVLASYCYGVLLRVVTPAPGRVEPDCPHFKKCGGCSLRHMSYATELRLKEDVVRSNVSRIGKVKAPCKPILPSPVVEGYRNKAQFPVAKIDGKVVAGFFAKRSHRIIGCADCALQPPVFAALLQEICGFLERRRVPIYEEASHSGLVRHIYLRKAFHTGEVMVCLVVNGKTIPHLGQLCTLLTTKFPEVKSIVLNHNTQKTNVILGDSCTTVWGSDTITDVMRGIRVKLSPQSFYQVNLESGENLYAKAEEYAALTGEETLVDLYCGAGTIGLSMAAHVKELIGVEIVPEAIEDAKANAKENGITNARFLCADATGAAKTLFEEGVRPDVVITDPPRKGCAKEVLEAICAMGPSRIVMISCNSATLSRDLALLEEMGYETKEYQPVDMFPRTTHVECVALLVKSNQ